MHLKYQMEKIVSKNSDLLRKFNLFSARQASALLECDKSVTTTAVGARLARLERTRKGPETRLARFSLKMATGLE